MLGLAGAWEAGVIQLTPVVHENAPREAGRSTLGRLRHMGDHEALLPTGAPSLGTAVR